MPTSPNDFEAVADRLAGLVCVLFDLDGTLIDSIPLIRESLRHATCEVLGETIADEDLLRHVGLPLRQQMAMFCRERTDELVDCYRAHNAESHDELLGGFDGIPETLDRLEAAGLGLGVVTSKTSAMALRGLEHAGIRAYFDVVVGADDVERHKPDPLPLVVAARCLGVETRSCAYVGDSAFDIEAARAAGALAIGAVWGTHDADALKAAGPDLVLRSASELEGLVKRGAVGNKHEGAIP